MQLAKPVGRKIAQINWPHLLNKMQQVKYQNQLHFISDFSWNQNRQ